MERDAYVAFTALFLILAAGILLTYHQNISGKNFCTVESRAAEACMTLYEPVCGYTNSGRQSFSNSCFACMDPTVLYWIEGDC